MISKLITEIKKKNAPVVVGLDPQLAFLPKFLLDKAVKEKGETLDAVADAIFEYNKGNSMRRCPTVTVSQDLQKLYEGINTILDNK